MTLEAENFDIGMDGIAYHDGDRDVDFRDFMNLRRTFFRSSSSPSFNGAFDSDDDRDVDLLDFIALLRNFGRPRTGARASRPLTLNAVFSTEKNASQCCLQGMIASQADAQTFTITPAAYERALRNQMKEFRPLTEDALVIPSRVLSQTRSNAS